MTTPAAGQTSGTAAPAEPAAFTMKDHRMLMADASGPPLPPGPRDPLAEPSAPDLGALGLATLRTLRRDAQREEADLSYLRRMLHGRIDILQAELARRVAPAPAALVDRLPEILTDEPSTVRSSARHVTLGTPLTDTVRRLAEDMLSEVELSDLSARTDAELHAAHARLVRHEQHVSGRRHTLQLTIDASSTEIARRYRAGEAHVDDLLADEA
ncbi:RsiG family protein [Actinacidiphila acididurans]|uniref:ABC transporter substrate-binding protein n=1 Tax=Actinacidiphila acididurans TaxID=2784346 RepID=A0ABS2TYQ4_9ACTN|nr:ABC transporter substrate-binding protein [Actinacidiphila acididurans]